MPSRWSRRTPDSFFGWVLVYEGLVLLGRRLELIDRNDAPTVSEVIWWLRKRFRVPVWTVPAGGMCGYLFDHFWRGGRETPAQPLQVEGVLRVTTTSAPTI